MGSFNYDNVILGSSPILLLEAVFLAISGKKVIILEKKERLGGAWYLLDFFNNISIESGCHIWYRDKRTYDFLKTKLGITLAPGNPQPRIIINNKKIPYKLKKFIKLYEGIRKNLLNPSYWPSLLRQFIEESSTVSKYYYPRRGSVELIERLQKLINGLKIEVLKNQKLTEIKILKNHTEIELLDGKKIYCNKIIASSHTELDNLSLYGKSKVIKNRNQNSNFSIHILLETIEKIGLSYLHVLKNNTIIRVANLNFQIEKSNLNENLLCVQVTKKLVQENGETEKTANLVLQELMNLKIIPLNSKLIKFKFSTYTCYYRNFDEAKKLKQELKQKVRFINSINLMYSISRELNRWLKLDKTNKIQSLSNKK